MSGLADTYAGLLKSAWPVNPVAGIGDMMIRNLDGMSAGLLKSAWPVNPVAGIGAGVAPLLADSMSSLAQDIANLQVQWATVDSTIQPDPLSDSISGTSLTREATRLLFGDFIYCLVFIVVMMAYINVTEKPTDASAAFSDLIFATGWSAHWIAKQAREAAFRAFDFRFPRE